MGLVRRPRAGLSLIELLAGISIISTLSALLFPIYAGAKENARRSQCAFNLKQIGMAFDSYLSDWSGFYPNTGDPYLWMGRRWRWPLKPYLALTAQRDPNDPNRSVGNTYGILICPSDDDAKTKYDGTSYGYSAAFYHTPSQINSMTLQQLWNPSYPSPPCVSQSSADVKYPSRKAIAGEWITAHSQDKVGWWSWLGARNYLFADGHVAFIQANKIAPANDSWPDINLTIDGVYGQDIR
jgi:prepilin-type processing-associated H-X9-DG protein